MYDLLIKNVRIIDGTGSPWYRGDVAVRNGKIADIGKINDNEAKDIVNGNDHYLSPGFIDIHSHSDTSILDYPFAESKLFQGVTTEIGGDCGMSAAPVSHDPSKKIMLKDYLGELPFTWNSFGEYLDTVENISPSINFGSAVGQGTIRIAAMGFDNRVPTIDEMTEMKALLAESLEDGAFCLSSGLIYPPGCYSDTNELSELCKTLKDYNSFYETHMRNEGCNVEEALKEAIEISYRSGAPLQVAHHKITDRTKWEVACRKTIAMIDKARKEGVEIMADQYPYIATSTSLDSNVSLWAFEGGMSAMLDRLKNPETRAILKKEAKESHKGRWHTIYVSYAESEKNQWVIGKNIVEIAEARGVDPEDACFDLILEEKGRVNEVNYGMCEEDVEYIMKKPYVMIGSDGQSVSLDYPGQPHPRYFGTFPRVLAHYCRDRKLFPLEEAVRKMTSLPATRLKLNSRGIIRTGMQADLVLFDFDRINDNPDYQHPKKTCDGIEKVYVNGVLTIDNGKHTGARAGHVLRRGKE